MKLLSDFGKSITVKVAFIFLISTVIFSSCTIEKRQHRGGYHVQIQRKLKSQRNQEIGKTSHEKEPRSANAIASVQKSREQCPANDVVSTVNEEVDVKPNKWAGKKVYKKLKSIVKTSKKAGLLLSSKKNKGKDNDHASDHPDNNDPDETKESNNSTLSDLSKYSFFALILSLMLFVAGFILLSLNLATLFVALAWIGIVVMAIALLLSALSFFELQNGEKEYKWKWLSWLVLALSYLGVFFGMYGVIIIGAIAALSGTTLTTLGIIGLIITFIALLATFITAIVMNIVSGVRWLINQLK